MFSATGRILPGSTNQHDPDLQIIDIKRTPEYKIPNFFGKEIRKNFFIENKPSIYVLRRNPQQNNTKLVDAYFSTASKISPFNEWGYIPVISTLTGLSRVLLGLVHLVIHAVSACFSKMHKQEHKLECQVALNNIFRGFTESVPVIGNIICILYDKLREHTRYMGYNPDEDSKVNAAELYSNGTRKIKTLSELAFLANEKHNKSLENLSFQEMANLIKN